METLGETFGEDTFISVNFTKLNEKVKACKIRQDNQKCRRELEEIGIKWVDEN